MPGRFHHSRISCRKGICAHDPAAFSTRQPKNSPASTVPRSRERFAKSFVFKGFLDFFKNSRSLGFFRSCRKPPSGARPRPWQGPTPPGIPGETNGTSEGFKKIRKTHDPLGFFGVSGSVTISLGTRNPDPRSLLADFVPGPFF